MRNAIHFLPCRGLQEAGQLAGCLVLRDRVELFEGGGQGPRTAEQAYDTTILASEVQNLPDYKLYVRTLLAGRPMEPFLVQSFPAFEKTGAESDPETIIRTSQQRYGCDRADSEAPLNRFLAVK